MMKLEVKDLVFSGTGAEENLEIKLSPEDFKDRFGIKGAKGEIRLLRIDEGILANFRFDSEVLLTCDRCLSEFIFRPPQASFSRVYLLRPEPNNDSLLIDKRMMIEVSEPIREEILLAVPYKKICQESCRGLCSKCGANLNIEDCKCK